MRLLVNGKMPMTETMSDTTATTAMTTTELVSHSSDTTVAMRAAAAQAATRAAATVQLPEPLSPRQDAAYSKTNEWGVGAHG